MAKQIILFNTLTSHEVVTIFPKVELSNHDANMHIIF